MRNPESIRNAPRYEATGQAEAIRAVANATADGVKAVAAAVQANGGMEAVQLRVAEKLVASGIWKKSRPTRRDGV